LPTFVNQLHNEFATTGTDCRKIPVHPDTPEKQAKAAFSLTAKYSRETPRPLRFKGWLA